MRQVYKMEKKSNKTESWIETRVLLEIVSFMANAVERSANSALKTDSEIYYRDKYTVSLRKRTSGQCVGAVKNKHNRTE